jgi:hypothetical protein
MSVSDIRGSFLSVPHIASLMRATLTDTWVWIASLRSR